MAPITEHPIMNADERQVILFSSKSKNYSFLSNFYISEMTIDGRLYNHVEGYYQSRKFVGINNSAVEHIRNITSPMACKKIGGSYPMTEDRKRQWDNGVKDTVMRQAVYTKFITNSELSKRLIETEDNVLIENNHNDTYWGGGRDGKGENKLGRILMDVRDLLQNIC